jgi:hypothetical protein
VDGVRDSQGIVCDLEPDSRRLVVTFGGLIAELATVGPATDGRDSTPVFEFARSLGSVPLKKVYVRDHAGVWYHRGVAGVGPDVDSVAQHLRELTAEAGEVVMIGNSAGGYAALLFGALLGSEVHAFNPQTLIDSPVDARYADLLPLLAQSEGRFHVYYSAGGDDEVQAERLRALPRVTLHPLDSPGQDLLKTLRAGGWMRSFVRALVTRSPVPAPRGE